VREKERGKTKARKGKSVKVEQEDLGLRIF
jgi:hypothetical protein